MSEKRIEEAETYSLIFSSLKHPLRRRILRMLAQEPLAFSEILDTLSIDSGHLSYHLESLGDLIMHTPDGKYRLSSAGVATVKLMSGVEETPKPEIRKELLGDIRMRKFRIFTVFLVPLLLLGFWWFQQSAIHNKNFLELTFYSFIFLGMGAFLLLSSRIEKASRKMRSMLYAVTIASLIVTIIAANSIATVPRTGETIYHYISYPEGTMLFNRNQDAQCERTLLQINYSVRDPDIDFPIDYIDFRADKSVSFRGTFWVYLRFLPEHKIFSGTFIFSVGNVTIYTVEWFDGEVWHIESHGFGEIDDWIESWHIAGHYEGYSVSLLVKLRIDEWYSVPTYPLKVTFHLEPEPWPARAWGRPTLSNYQKGIAILLCGVFAGIYIEILGKGLIPTMKIKTTMKIKKKIQRLKQWLHTKMKISGTAKPEQLTLEELYMKMLDSYIRFEGSTHGKWLLEKKIAEYVKQGLSREKAIRKVAKDEGYA